MRHEQAWHADAIAEAERARRLYNSRGVEPTKEQWEIIATNDELVGGDDGP